MKVSKDRGTRFRHVMISQILLYLLTYMSFEVVVEEKKKNKVTNRD